jgi:hypothetical protein
MAMPKVADCEVFIDKYVYNDEESDGAIVATMMVQIPDPTEATLRRQAMAAGKPIEQFVIEVLEAQASSGRTLREISGDVSDQFIASGMTEEQLAEQLEREDHAARGVPYATLQGLMRVVGDSQKQKR